MPISPNQFLEIIPRGKNIDHYKKLGYNFEKGESIIITPEELPTGSKVIIDVECDCCGKNRKVENKTYNNSLKKHGGKYYCLDCYNHENDLKEYRQQKIEDGVWKAYGTNNVFQSEDIKVKIKETLLNKYGEDNPLKVDSIKKKVEETNMEKYGAKVALNNQEIHKKAQESLYKHGTQKCSSQQYNLYQLILENIECDECELNKPVSLCFADIHIKFDEILIDIEYDGSYWHQDKQRDRRRDEVFKKYGYKILRIKARREVPSLEQVKEALNVLISTDKIYYELVMSDYIENNKT